MNKDTDSKPTGDSRIAALEAIAAMQPDSFTDPAQLAALCIAIARVELAKPEKDNNR